MNNLLGKHRATEISNGVRFTAIFITGCSGVSSSIEGPGCFSDLVVSRVGGRRI